MHTAHLVHLVFYLSSLGLDHSRGHNHILSDGLEGVVFDCIAISSSKVEVQVKIEIGETR